MTDQTSSDTPGRGASRGKGLVSPIARLRGIPSRGKAPDTSGADALLAYWARLRRGPDIPYRADLDPREISALLPNMLLVERIAPGVARMRVTGAQVSSLLGMDLRGMPLSVLFDPEDRDTLCHHTEEVFEAPSALNMVLDAAGSFGRVSCAARLSLLPLRDGRGEINRAVGLLMTSSAVTKASRRFQIKSCKTTSVLKLPMPDAKSRSQPAKLATMPALSPPTGVPYLRLVHSV